MQNDEFAQAEAALAIMMQAEAEAEVNAQAEAEIEAEALYQQALEAERLAPTTDEAQTEADENENNISGTPVFNTIALNERLGVLAQSYIDEIGVLTTTSNTTDNVIFNPGLLHRIDQIENVDNYVSPPSPEITIDHVNDSEFDTDEFMSYDKIKSELSLVLEDLYPGKWDWQENGIILIYFPVINITNSKNEHHKIVDLYVKLKYIHVNTRFSGSVQGTRSRYTNTEISSYYSHSHLPSTSRDYAGTFNGFCLGDSTLNFLLSDLATLDMTIENLEDIKLKFMLVCMELENYLQWESLEGGPYKKIATIGSGNLNSLYHREINENGIKILKHFWQNIKSNKYKPQLKFNNNQLLEIINNDLFLHQISKYCDNYYLVYRDGAGNFYSTTESRSLDGKINNNSISFRGKNISIRIIKNDKLYEKSGKDFAHPKIVKWCKQQIENSLNSIWKSEIERTIIARNIKREWKTKNLNKSLFKNITHVWDTV